MSVATVEVVLIVVVVVVVVVVGAAVDVVVGVGMVVKAGVGAHCRLFINSVLVCFSSPTALPLFDTCRGLVRGSTCLCFR